MAVSKAGTLAIVCRGGYGGGLVLYRSNDRGVTFNRYVATVPRAFEYSVYTPFALAYDTTNTLWLLWAWDEYFDGFPLGYYLVLSKCASGDTTFSDVVQFNRGLILNESRMIIDRNNNVHILHDSLVYPQGPRLVYTHLTHGDPANRFDSILPYPDSLYQPHYYADFVADGDSTIHCAIDMITTSGGSEYIAYSRSTDSGNSFTSLRFIDTTTQQGQFRMTLTPNNLLFIAYSFHPLLWGFISEDNGNTFSNSFPLTYSNLSANGKLKRDSTSTYLYFIQGGGGGIGLGSVYKKYYDPRNLPVDSMYFDSLIIGDLAIGLKGEKYVVFKKRVGYTELSPIYISSKDIPSSINHEENLIPENISIYSYPNPFNQQTKLLIDVPFRQSFKLEIYNILGQLVDKLFLNDIEPGRCALDYDGTHLSSGLYIALLRSKINIGIIKLILIK